MIFVENLAQQDQLHSSCVRSKPQCQKGTWVPSWAGGVYCCIIEQNQKGGEGVLELDEYKMELGKYKTPLAEVRDSL